MINRDVNIPDSANSDNMKMQELNLQQEALIKIKTPAKTCHLFLNNVVFKAISFITRSSYYS